MGASYSSFILLSKRSHSWSSSLPLFIFSPWIWQTFTINLFTSWTFDISNENTPIGNLKFTAIFFAIESTKAVLPIAGRAAIMIKSEFCQPDVISSSFLNPDCNPLIPSSLLAAISKLARASFITGFICITSFFTLRCDISNNLLSVSCIKSSISTISSKAWFTTSEEKEISWRARYFWEIIRAWYSTWAAEATLSVSSAT